MNFISLNHGGIHTINFGGLKCRRLLPGCFQNVKHRASVELGEAFNGSHAHFAIIAILTALLLAAVAQAKAKAQRVHCENNLRQLGIGIQVILTDDHGYPPFFENKYSSWIDQVAFEGLGMSKSITNFVRVGVWHCPASLTPNPQFFSTNSIFLSYGYNAHGVRDDGDNVNALGLLGHIDPVSGSVTPIREAEVRVPSQMMVVGESFQGRVSFDHQKLNDMLKYWNLYRHQGHANAVFCDGHVESPTLNFLFSDTSDEALSRWNRDHLPHRERLAP